MTTYSFFIDPIDGDDGNTGLSEGEAFASIIPALTLSGFVLQVDGSYKKTGLDNDDTLVFSFVKGTSLVPALALFVFSSGDLNLRLRGANNALVIFTGKVVETDSTISLIGLSGSTRTINFGIKGLRISQLAAVAATIFVYKSASSLGSNEGFVNCVIRGFTTVMNSSSSAPAIYVTTEGVFQGAAPSSTTGSLIGSAAVLQELTPYSWTPTPEKILLGLGAILPQPGGDYEYIPTATQNFLAEGWVNDATYVGGTAQIRSSSVSIDSGASARALGPVINYPTGISFSTTRVSAIEDETRPSGSKEVIDSTELDSARTIDVRSSDTPFAQTDSTPAWVPILKDSSHALVSGKYIQFRVTLTKEGV